MVDLVFEDSVMQRKMLAQKFATVCERQVFFQSDQIEKKDEMLANKDKEISDLLLEIEKFKNNEMALKITNKKLSMISQRSQAKAQEAHGQKLAYERQVKFLSGRLGKLEAMLDQQQLAVFQKETRRGMQKI